MLYSTSDKKNQRNEDVTVYHRSYEILRITHRKLKVYVRPAAAAAVIGDLLLSVLTLTYGWGMGIKGWARCRKPPSGNPKGLVGYSKPC